MPISIFDNKPIVSSRERAMGISKINPTKFPITPGTDTAAPKQVPKAQDLSEKYDTWRKRQTPENMSSVLNASNHVINNALTSYTQGDSPIMRSHARRLAVEAIQKYDPSSGVKLDSWMMSHLRGLTRQQQQASPVRTPERISYELHRVNQSRQEYLDENGMPPSDTEMADRTGLSVKRLQYIRNFSGAVMPESSIKDQEGATFMPGLPDNHWQNIWTEYVYNDLDPINKKIYDMTMGRNGHKKTPKGEIARALKMTTSAVSQRAGKIEQQLAEGKSIPDMGSPYQRGESNGND